MNLFKAASDIESYKMFWLTYMPESRYVQCLDSKGQHKANCKITVQDVHLYW